MAPETSARRSMAGSTALADRVEELPDRVQLYIADGERALEQVHARAEIPVGARARAACHLEDVFLRLTGRTLID